MSNTLITIIKEFRQRETFGLVKYQASIGRTDLAHREWLQHAKEEAMDFVLYLQRILDTLE
jgi:hypothetical protein